MKSQFLLASGLAGLLVAAPASAQSHMGHNMPGMTMPKPAKKPAAKKPAAKKKPIAAKKPVAAKPAATKPSVTEAAPPAAEAPAAHDHGAMDHEAMPGMAMPSTTPPSAATTMDHNAMPGMDHAAMGHEAHAMTGALGVYPAGRESSGTAWAPDSTEHRGLMRQAGEWMLMGHADLNLVGSFQGGRRGADKVFVGGMLMGMARRPVGAGTLQLRGAVSPDPLMGKSGYPLLLASGETADGVNRLIDRQHPHDFFMELSASLSQPIGAKSSVFLYGGLPGEPAFGPGAYMHREAAMDSPEAPITHHWLDSQHISFGVLTGGVVLDRVKFEVSRFNGREPDQYRWNIETGPLDSTALRASWNPTADLALQVSWADLKEPEQLEPGVNQKRWSASALYGHTLGDGSRVAGTLAWGRRTAEGHSYDAFAAEGSWKKGLWTVFGRGELTENNELLEVADHHGEAFRVGKVSAGAVRDFRIADRVKLGVGGLLSVNFVPAGLAPEYGGRNPLGAMAFVRLKVG
ncbi:hypothetical protein GCM10022281_18180 [Sphingomonas rosea]|uniref:Uncharacterized protein n=1 Tax=Sphingomonas rosea TaxID=335605 RepID=A0ABP7U8R4_9SPHN